MKNVIKKTLLILEFFIFALVALGAAAIMLFLVFSHLEVTSYRVVGLFLVITVLSNILAKLTFNIIKNYP